MIALKRCGVVAQAVVLNIVDYKYLFWRSWEGEDELETEKGVRARAERHQAYSDTHKRCAERVLEALKKVGGILYCGMCQMLIPAL